MVGIAARPFSPCSQQVLLGDLGGGKWKEKLKKREWQCHAMSERKPKKRILIKNQMAEKRVASFSSRTFTDVAFYESPRSSFDRYLEHKDRVFEAMFPGARSLQKLNEEEWRVQMLPVSFVLHTISPVINIRIRCRTAGKDYPPGVPEAITKVLQIDMPRWEVQGLDHVFESTQISIGLEGVLYADRHGQQTRLKGHLEMSTSFVLHPVLALIPEDVHRTLTESALKGLLADMQHKGNGSLLADYRKFRRE